MIEWMHERMIEWMHERPNDRTTERPNDRTRASLHEFLVGLRGEMNERRTQIALQAFALLDEDFDGVVDGDVLLDTYDPAGHPDVVSGARKESAVTREFLDTFDGADKGGDVSPSGFLRYSANISSHIDSDEAYEAMMRGVWQLPPGDSGCRRMVRPRAVGWLARARAVWATR